MEIPMPKNRTLSFTAMSCPVFARNAWVLCACRCIGPLLPDNFSYAVRIAPPIERKGCAGERFYYRTEESIYLVTARHVLFALLVAIKEGANFAIRAGYFIESVTKKPVGFSAFRGFSLRRKKMKYLRTHRQMRAGDKPSSISTKSHRD